MGTGQTAPAAAETKPESGIAGRPEPRFAHVIESWRDWWHTAVVETVDKRKVIDSRREESDITARYMLMLAMSAGIAILGLLLSSPAVVIGAMLLSPLMGPIIGLGFALATGEYHWIRQTSNAHSNDTDQSNIL